ncbi:NAD(P)-dependent alcohol dehydrogenase [Alkalicoccus luteus]|uniref:NAD(P)-dependent alcohol dehydrogenase n=1 Tax=Alkalicoccus luteus TaxID=1237094 RepID=UPI004033D4F7
MKAVRVTAYGGPENIRITEENEPVPQENELLIRVEAAVVTPPDCAFRAGRPAAVRLFTGIRRPKRVPGDTFAGVIVKTGDRVKEWRSGMHVFGSSSTQFGAHAEYMVIRADSACAFIPEGTSYAEAASLSYGGLTALPFIRDHAQVSPGKAVWINGAAGGVGVYAVQFARLFGADVTASAAGRNSVFLQNLDVDNIHDYSCGPAPEGIAYDIMFDIPGTYSFSEVRPFLAKQGRYMTADLKLNVLYRMLTSRFRTGPKAVFAATGLRKPADVQQDLRYLAELVREKRIRPVTDRIFGLSEAAEAHRYVETEKRRGPVILDVRGNAALTPA